MIYLCFCAYNEALNIPGLMDNLAGLVAQLPQPARILAYNDGSTDATGALLAQARSRLPLELIDSPVNQGLGRGIGQLMQYLALHGAPDDTAIFFDADNTHGLQTVPAFINALATGYDLVIASRFQRGSRCEGFPLYRRALSRLASWYFTCMLPLDGVKDYTSGFRAYRIGSLQKIDFAVPLLRGFECQVELLHRLAKFSRITEIPFHYRYGEKRGASKMRLCRTVMRSVALGLGIAMQRFFVARPHVTHYPT